MSCSLLIATHLLFHHRWDQWSYWRSITRSHTWPSLRRWCHGIIFTTSGMLKSYCMWQGWGILAFIAASGGVDTFQTLGGRCHHNNFPVAGLKSCPLFLVSNSLVLFSICEVSVNMAITFLTTVRHFYYLWSNFQFCLLLTRGCTYFMSLCYSFGGSSPCTGLACFEEDIVSVGEDGRLLLLTARQKKPVRRIGELAVMGCLFVLRIVLYWQVI